MPPRATVLDEATVLPRATVPRCDGGRRSARPGAGGRRAGAWPARAGAADGARRRGRRPCGRAARRPVVRRPHVRRSEAGPTTRGRARSPTCRDRRSVRWTRRRAAPRPARRRRHRRRDRWQAHALVAPAPRARPSGSSSWCSACWAARWAATSSSSTRASTGSAGSTSPPAAAGEPQNYLIVAIDTREGQGSRNTDTIMVVRIDPGSDRLALHVVPPRSHGHDRRHGRDRDDQLGVRPRPGGEQNLIDTLKQNFDITINHYVQVNFESFRQVVESIGGVPVWMPNAAPRPSLGPLQRPPRLRDPERRAGPGSSSAAGRSSDDRRRRLGARPAVRREPGPAAADLHPAGA